MSNVAIRPEITLDQGVGDRAPRAGRGALFGAFTTGKGKGPFTWVRRLSRAFDHLKRFEDSIEDVVPLMICETLALANFPRGE